MGLSIIPWRQSVTPKGRMCVQIYHVIKFKVRTTSVISALYSILDHSNQMHGQKPKRHESLQLRRYVPTKDQCNPIMG